MVVQWMDVVALSRKLCKVPVFAHLKYATAENFLGRAVNGYREDASDFCLLTSEAAAALCRVQNELIENQALSLAVYDSYRPLRAVKDFAQWMRQPPAGEFELLRKKIHYPEIEKSRFSELGYLSSTVSKHCFGSTVDLVLRSVETGQDVDMGSIFDFLGERSQTVRTAQEIGPEAYRNRRILIDAMTHHGFTSYEKEYWHFEFRKYDLPQLLEPFDFEITPGWRGVGV